MSTIEKETEKPQTPNHEYPSNRKRIVIMTALYLSLFLVILDQNIIATAIPKITDEFNSLDDIGWYSSAFLLTTASFQLLMGKIYKFFPAKPVFLIMIGIFEVGSALCGAAPNSVAFIVGRAIAGVGSSGIFPGLMVMMMYAVPLRQRPIYQGLFGAVFAVGSVIGPLLGGVFTDKVTWRWCFYINLPIGAVVAVIVILILHLPNQKLEQENLGLLAILKKLDPIGNFVFFPGIICLILALTWGGSTYPWNNARIIALFVLCGVFLIAFIGIQIWKQEEAALPPRIIKNRSVLAASWFTFFQGASMMVMLYYLPIWFQAVKNETAYHSGIMLLPMVLATVVGSIGSGILVSKTGYYAPFFIFSSVIMPIGAGLMTTFTPTTGHSKWIGYQVLYGIALGAGAQQPMNVIQTVLPRTDVATGSAVIFFIRFLGSAIFVPIAESILLNELVHNLTNLAGISPQVVANTGATALRSLVQGSDLALLIADYNGAVINVFYLVTAMAAVTILGSVFVEWRSMKVEAKKEDSKPKAEGEETDLEAATPGEETKEGSN